MTKIVIGSDLSDLRTTIRLVMAVWQGGLLIDENLREIISIEVYIYGPLTVEPCAGVLIVIVGTLMLTLATKLMENPFP